MQKCFIISTGKIAFTVKAEKAKPHVLDHTETLFSLTLDRLLGLIVSGDIFSVLQFTNSLKHCIWSLQHTS